jgi:hypothetical protein
MGTSTSSLTEAPARLGYPFTVSFQPDSRYPFKGWRVWVENDGVWAYWKPEDIYGEETVLFVPKNANGTEVEITVYREAPGGKTINIGPWGGDSDEMIVLPQAGGLGTIYPATLSGIKAGFPFTVSYEPFAAYEFRGWQAVVAAILQM